MSDFKPGDRIRGVVEGVFDRDYNAMYVAGVGVYIVLSDLKDVEKIKEPPPAEPGSIITVTDSAGLPTKAILVGANWYWLDIGALIISPIETFNIVSIDRVGV